MYWYLFEFFIRALYFSDFFYWIYFQISPSIKCYLDIIKNRYKEFSNLSLQQRISLHKLREDRADVIVPALLIYINVMRWTDAQEIFVPKIGLADGLIHNLYEEVKLKEIEI